MFSLSLHRDLFWGSWKNAAFIFTHNLTVMEGHCFERAKIEKLHSYYSKDENNV